MTQEQPSVPSSHTTFIPIETERPPTALIDFPKLEPGHVWLMAMMASLSNRPLDAQMLADAAAVVEKYRRLYGF